MRRVKNNTLTHKLKFYTEIHKPVLETFCTNGTGNGKDKDKVKGKIKGKVKGEALPALNRIQLWKYIKYYIHFSAFLTSASCGRSNFISQPFYQPVNCCR